jgi:hypothetical protein
MFHWHSGQNHKSNTYFEKIVNIIYNKYIQDFETARGAAIAPDISSHILTCLVEVGLGGML